MGKKRVDNQSKQNLSMLKHVKQVLQETGKSCYQLELSFNTLIIAQLADCSTTSVSDFC